MVSIKVWMKNKLCYGMARLALHSLDSDIYCKICVNYLFLNYRSEKPDALESVMIGASARTLAGVTVLPITVMKTRYEVRGHIL